MNRKTFLGSLLSFGLFTQNSDLKKEKTYVNGQCPVCDTSVSEWMNEPKCEPPGSKDVIKPPIPDFCLPNEVTGSLVFQQHVCQKCKTIFAYRPTSIKRR